MQFKFNFEEEVHPFFSGGTRKRFIFENGYAASVVDGSGAYCTDGTYELAVLKDGALCYDTHITDDVLGYLKPDEVVKLLFEIASLPPTDKALACKSTKALEYNYDLENHTADYIYLLSSPR